MAKIERNVQKNKDLASRFSRSPGAIKTIQALEAATAIFRRTKPNPEYEIAEYATGNRCWKRAPAQHPVPVQDLLLYNVQVKHDQNEILGEKVAEVVRQNIHLAQQASRAYDTPSKKLKKDPIMGLFTKTVATYMSLKHNNEQKQNNNLDPEDFSSWGNHFSKRRSESESKRNRNSERQIKRYVKGINKRNQKSESKRNRKSESQEKRYVKGVNKKNQKSESLRGNIKSVNKKGQQVKQRTIT